MVPGAERGFLVRDVDGPSGTQRGANSSGFLAGAPFDLPRLSWTHWLLSVLGLVVPRLLRPHPTSLIDLHPHPVPARPAGELLAPCFGRRLLAGTYEDSTSSSLSWMLPCADCPRRCESLSWEWRQVLKEHGP